MSSCSVCLTAKGNLSCGHCDLQICKACAEFLADDDFAFMPKVNDILTKSAYCPNCFDIHVRPDLDIYNELLEKAKNFPVYSKTQSKETRLMRRNRPKLVASDCEDKEEALLKLAFLAVYETCTAIVDVEVISKKVRNHAYQTLTWEASGMPIKLDKHQK